MHYESENAQSRLMPYVMRWFCVGESCIEVQSSWNEKKLRRRSNWVDYQSGSTCHTKEMARAHRIHYHANSTAINVHSNN